MGEPRRPSPAGLAESSDLNPVVANGLDWTTLLGFLAKRFLFWGRRLFVDVGIATFIVAGKIGRRSFATEIAVDTLIIDVKFTCDAFLVPVCEIGHILVNFEISNSPQLSTAIRRNQGDSLFFETNDQQPRS